MCAIFYPRFFQRIYFAIISMFMLGSQIVVFFLHESSWYVVIYNYRYDTWILRQFYRKYLFFFFFQQCTWFYFCWYTKISTYFSHFFNNNIDWSKPQFLGAVGYGENPTLNWTDKKDNENQINVITIIMNHIHLCIFRVKLRTLRSKILLKLVRKQSAWKIFDTKFLRARSEENQIFFLFDSG